MIRETLFHLLRQFITVRRLSLHLRVPCGDDQIAVIPHGRCQDFGVPAAARPDFHDRVTVLDSKKCQGFRRVTVLVTCLIGIGTMIALRPHCHLFGKCQITGKCGKREQQNQHAKKNRFHLITPEMFVCESYPNSNSFESRHFGIFPNTPDMM